MLAYKQQHIGSFMQIDIDSLTKKKHKKLSSKIQNWWNGVYPNKPKSVKQRGNFQTKTFHKWHSQERQRTTEQTKFKFPKLTKWGLPQNSKRHGKFKTKPKRYIVVMIKTWEEKKKKRKRVCVLKPTFSGIRKANDEERKQEIDSSRGPIIPNSQDWTLDVGNLCS